ncbi:MAG: hypothetical protein NVSMB32_03390 [Actinomycetota bacterium]
MSAILAGLWCRVVRQTRDDERGAFAIVAALLLTVMVFGAALSVDIAGRVVQIRRDEATADMGALDSVRDLTAAATTQDLAWRSALRNGADHTLPGIVVTATRGVYSGGIFSATGSSPNAVKVSVSSPYHDFFGGTSASLTGTAIATNIALAQFSIGATLADVNAGLGKMGVANLDVLGYGGLASGNFSLSALRSALGGSFSALSADQLLTSSVTAGQLASAAATLLSATNPTAAASVSTLAANLKAVLTGNTTIQLGNALGLRQGNGVALGSSVNLLQAVSGAIQVTNQSAGISLNLGISGVGNFSVTGLVPGGISDYGPVGIAKSNTQVTATVTISVPLTALGLPLLSVTLPLTMGLGGATGTLTAIDCPTTLADIQLATIFKNVNAAVGAGTVTSAGLTVAAVSGNVLAPSNPVPNTTVPYPANFLPNTATVRATSSLGASTANLALSTPVAGLSVSALDSLIAPMVDSIISTATSQLGSSWGINVGNADYLGLRASCLTPHLVG